MKALESFLRPEFINRVDEIVYFNKLTEDNFKAIAAIMLRELQDALKEKGITFTWDDALLDYLVKKSYSMTYGPQSAPPDSEGSGGRHRHQAHRQLPPSHPEHPCLRRRRAPGAHRRINQKAPGRSRGAF